MKKKRTIIVFAICFVTTTIPIYAAEFGSIGNPYPGLPIVNLKLSNIDSSGELIYCGIDIGVWEDPDKDGMFTIKERKVRRYITTSKNITLDPGVINDYRMGILHKLAMRTLYVPVGQNQDLIVIADQNNGKDGWVEIPNSVFRPTYFINLPNSPYIKHTNKWDENRTIYNEAKEKFGISKMKREESAFWSGEKFKLFVETAMPVEKVRVRIVGESKNISMEPYSIDLTSYTKHPTVSGAAIYTGELWDKSMINKWGNYIPKELTFKLEVFDDKGELLEDKETKIAIDNRDLYFRSRREY